MKVFLPYGPMLTKTKKNREKSKIKTFEKQTNKKKKKPKKKKWSGDMVDRYLSPKFGINSFSGIRENDVYGRRTPA